MHCKNCGKKIENDSLFCTFCGKKQSNEITAATEIGSNEDLPKKKSNFSLLGIICMAITMISIYAIIGNSGGILTSAIVGGIGGIVYWFVLSIQNSEIEINKVDKKDE